MITLTKKEIEIASRMSKLKEAAGTHSPSIFTVLEQLPEVKIQIDACFLSNPYATSLFLQYFKSELIDTNQFRDVLEFYPSQNQVIAEIIGNSIQIPRENIFVGNGAIEVIQAVMHRYVESKVVIIIPTFSSYYEFVRNDTEVVFYSLNKDHNFELDVDHYISFIKAHKPDSIVLINPNNPNGAYIPYDKLRYILNSLKEIKNIIIDESFIHFAYEDDDLKLVSATELYKEFTNVIVIKSMSKDFGIAGIRSGYAVMNKNKVLDLLKNGYLWNSSGLSEFFFKLYRREAFFEQYEEVRKKYIKEASLFFNSLAEIEQLKVYPSKANFALVELLDGTTASNFVNKLLIKYGVYTRNCSDKIGLSGEFVRIASRSKSENERIVQSIKQAFFEDGK